MSDARVVLTTCADAPGAEALARALVEERLAACVNLVPHVRSIYRWQSEIEESDEILCVIKTTERMAGAVTKRIQELSGYNVPEAVVLNVEGGSAPYLDWIAASVG